LYSHLLLLHGLLPTNFLKCTHMYENAKQDNEKRKTHEEDWVSYYLWILKVIVSKNHNASYRISERRINCKVISYYFCRIISVKKSSKESVINPSLSSSYFLKTSVILFRLIQLCTKRSKLIAPLPLLS